MKRALVAVAAALLALGLTDAARAQQQGQPYGMMGPMMQGQGWMSPGMQGGTMGPGMMGQGWPGAGMQGGMMGPMGQGMMGGGPMMQGQGMMGPGMQGGGMMMGPGMMGGMMMGPTGTQLDAYLALAKGQLGISTDQEQAWTAYVESIKNAAGTMAGNRQAMMTSCMQGSMSMPDMHAQMVSLMETRLAALKEVGTAANALYDKLSPQQRGLADRLLPQGMGMI